MRSWALQVLLKPWGHCKNRVHAYKLYSFFLSYSWTVWGEWLQRKSKWWPDRYLKSTSRYFTIHADTGKNCISGHLETPFNLPTPPLVITFIIIPVPKTLLTLSNNSSVCPLSEVAVWIFFWERKWCLSGGHLQPDNSISKSLFIIKVLVHEQVRPFELVTVHQAILPYLQLVVKAG